MYRSERSVTVIGSFVLEVPRLEQHGLWPLVKWRDVSSQICYQWVPTCWISTVYFWLHVPWQEVNSWCMAFDLLVPMSDVILLWDSNRLGQQCLAASTMQTVRCESLCNAWYQRDWCDFLFNICSGSGLADSTYYTNYLFMCEHNYFWLLGWFHQLVFIARLKWFDFLSFYYKKWNLHMTKKVNSYLPVVEEHNTFQSHGSVNTSSCQAQLFPLSWKKPGLVHRKRCSARLEPHVQQGFNPIKLMSHVCQEKD